MKNIELIKNTDKEFPQNLLNIEKSPKELYIMGNKKLLNKKSLAIVGTRNCTPYGAECAKKFATDISKKNICIISGMALGIDTFAHNGALKEKGNTIAVLGCGFDYIYPEENIDLFNKIVENGGLVVSEYPPKTKAVLSKFPYRNRIISGLSMGLLVIEAAYRSGTSITAKYAKIQERKVFCIPNSIGNKNSYGTINLIQNGAIMVKNAQDILKVLGIEYDKQKSIVKFKQLELLDNESQLIFDCINKNEEIDAEGISMKTGINISKVNELVTILEIDEVIKSVGFNKFKICEEYYE